MTALTPESRERLRRVSTATLSTVLFKRGLRNTYIRGVLPLNPRAPRMVGEAYTLRCIPARDDVDHFGVLADRSNPQRRGIEEIPPGHVYVADTRGQTRAAVAGGILITRLMMRGAAGFVTDGALRDSPELAALPFPVYGAAPAAPASVTGLHATELNVPIGCGEVAVYPGDVMVGDGDGVVVIPAGIANAVADEAAAQTELEDYVEERVRAGASIFGLYPPDDAAKAAFAAWQKRRS